MDIQSIVIFGYGPLALNTLKELISEYRIEMVVTHRDMTDYSVDKFCSYNNIVFNYSNPQKHMDYFKDLFSKSSKDQILISVNYKYIIPKEVFGLFRYAFNVHGSLLPKYRGRSPHVWAIINGEKKCGITSHIMEVKVDSGDIILQKEIDICDEDTSVSIIEKYRLNYPTIVKESIKKLLVNDPLIPQNHLYATYYGKRTPEMGNIDPYMNTKRIINLIRALRPSYSGAYFYNSQGEKMIIEEVMVYPKKSDEIGTLIEERGCIYLNCSENSLKILKYTIK